MKAKWLRKHTETYVRALYTGVPGLIEIRPTDVYGLRSFSSTDDLEDAIVDIQNSALDPKSNTYIGMATRVEEGSGRKDNLCAVKHLWIDADGLDTKEKRQAFGAKLDKFSKPPSMVIRSGPAGMHVYWILEKPINLQNKDTIRALEDTLLGLSEAFSSDPAVKDATRIMRVPGSLNRPDAAKIKKGRKEAFCKIGEYKPSRVYTFSSFAVYRSVGQNVQAQKRQNNPFKAHVDRYSNPNRPRILIPNKVLNEGERHGAMVTFAVSLRHNSCTDEQVEVALLKFNEQCCSPSKEDAEVRTIAAWACRVR